VQSVFAGRNKPEGANGLLPHCFVRTLRIRKSQSRPRAVIENRRAVRTQAAWSAPLGRWQARLWTQTPHRDQSNGLLVGIGIHRANDSGSSRRGATTEKVIPLFSSQRPHTASKLTLAGRGTRLGPLLDRIGPGFTCFGYLLFWRHA
jgi:hypothetical protein